MSTQGAEHNVFYKNMADKHKEKMCDLEMKFLESKHDLIRSKNTISLGNLKCNANAILEL